MVFSNKIQSVLGPINPDLVSMLLGCGYKMVGKETHLPPGIDSLAFPTFVNKTFEPGIEVPFTQGFLREFIQDRRVKVVGRDEADSVLEGVIKSFQVYSVSYDRSGVALEYQTTVVIDAGGTITAVGDNTTCPACQLAADFGYRYDGNNSFSGTVFYDAGNDAGNYSSGTDNPYPAITVTLVNCGSDATCGTGDDCESP